MSSKIGFIIHAWIKWAIGLITGETSNEMIERYKICQQCPNKKFGICKKCGCIVRVKASADYIIDPANGKTVGGCPDEKW